MQALKYTLRYETEKFKKDVRINIFEKDFAGSSCPKKIGAARIVLSKEKADKIQGSSLDFDIQSDSNFEYTSFFSGDNKNNLVQLIVANQTIWSGFIVSDQYSEKYIAPPYDVAIMCTDGLGLLKNEDFELTGFIDRFTAIRYCIGKIGLDLGYAIAVSLFETRMNNSAGQNMLNQLYFQAEILKEKTCYEALECLLPEGCVITQNNNRWWIGFPEDFSNAAWLFTSSGVAENISVSINYNSLGTISAGSCYPIDSLTMELEPALKSLLIKQVYGKKESFFKNYDFADGKTYWTPSSINAQRCFQVKNSNNLSFALLSGQQSNSVHCIRQSISVKQSTAVTFSINYTPVGHSVYGSPLTRNLTLVLRLVADSGSVYYVDQNKWNKTATVKYIQAKNVESSLSIDTLSFKTLQLVLAKLPESGTLTIEIYQTVCSSQPSTTSFIGLAVEKILFYAQDLALLADTEETTVVVSENATDPEKTIELMPVDLPDYENVDKYFKNGNYVLVNGSYLPANKWDSGVRFIEYISGYLAKKLGQTRTRLSGKITGENISLNCLIIHEFNNSKQFLVESGSWNIIDDEFDLSLIERIPRSGIITNLVSPPADPIYDLIIGEIINPASIFYRVSGDYIINNKLKHAVFDGTDNVSFPELDSDVFNRSDSAYWSGLSIIDSDVRKWPVAELKSATIAANGTAKVQNMLFLNDYSESVTDCFPICAFAEEQPNSADIQEYVAINQMKSSANLAAVDGSYQALLPGTKQALVVSRQGTIDPYSLDADSGTIQFSIRNGLITANYLNDANSVKIEAMDLISHHFNAISRGDLDILKSNGENYDPTRTWVIPETILTLSDNDGYFIYSRVPIDSEITSGEIVISKNHIEVKSEENYLNYKLGYIHPVKNGSREVSMLWGNSIGKYAFVYIAYASDATGTDFTTTFNASLDYIAIKTTTTAIATPTASDFAGLWKKYKGVDGVSPHIGVNGNWYIGATDTGITAQGPAGTNGYDGTNGVDGVSPHIGVNGNWYIGATDTGIAAQGPAGTNGYDGTNGVDGVSPHIGVNGNWYIGATDTGITATGPAGTNGSDGTNGVDGVSPHIGANGNWYIGATDTGIAAQGPQGPQGASGADGAQGPAGSNGVGIPSGGQVGQKLRKKSTTDYDTEWADETGISHAVQDDQYYASRNGYWTALTEVLAAKAALAGSATQQFSASQINLPNGGYITCDSSGTIHLYPGTSSEVVVHGQVTADAFYKN